LIDEPQNNVSTIVSGVFLALKSNDTFFIMLLLVLIVFQSVRLKIPSPGEAWANRLVDLAAVFLATSARGECCKSQACGPRQQGRKVREQSDLYPAPYMVMNTNIFLIINKLSAVSE
jgi:hypothetical protein